MADFDFEIFSGTTFKDLCKEVVTRSENKKDQIDILLSDVRTLIKDKNDAIILLPQIKSLLEVGVKNDEASGGSGVGLSDEEKDLLMQENVAVLKDMQQEVQQPIPIISGSISN